MELNKTQQLKKRAGKCVTPYCRNPHKKASNFCHKCEKRKYREKYPIKAAYTALKDNATRRQIPFELSFTDFKIFAIEHDILVKRGRTKKSYHIDRIDEKKGYTKGNIQLIEGGANVKKYLEYCKETGTARYYSRKEKPTKTNNPF